jgi:hypothetical protein
MDNWGARNEEFFRIMEHPDTVGRICGIFKDIKDLGVDVDKKQNLF